MDDTSFSSEGFVYVEDREAAPGTGCLSVFLHPLALALALGTLLLWGLTRISLTAFAETPAQAAPSSQLAPFFAPSVLRWESQILAWAAEHDLDPNLVATVMQIESCGDPGAVSSAGAMGLFQVMPYHFSAGEDSYDPDTNALRGLNYLARSLEAFDNQAAMAMAGYNGGINGASRPPSQRAQETVDYKYWGENIYADAANGREASPVLDQWMAAGGASLCAQAQTQVASIP